MKVSVAAVAAADIVDIAAVERHLVGTVAAAAAAAPGKLVGAEIVGECFGMGLSAAAAIGRGWSVAVVLDN